MFVLLLLAEQGLQGLQDPAGSSTAAKGDKLSEQSHWRSPHWLLTEHRIADEESLGAGFFFSCGQNESSGLTCICVCI